MSYKQKSNISVNFRRILGPHSAGPACTARLARPIVTPLADRQTDRQYEPYTFDQEEEAAYAIPSDAT